MMFDGLIVFIVFKWGGGLVYLFLDEDSGS